jgi:hypothetical protein|tara:strand:- start:1255 stop:1500 length:246 start_codon:yes stop_codon:yes gene_type:complete
MPLRVTTTAIANVAVLFLETAKFIAGKKNKKPAEVDSPRPLFGNPKRRRKEEIVTHAGFKFGFRWDAVGMKVLIQRKPGSP